MKIIWSTQALQDVEEIFDYILEENPDAAWDTYDRIMEYITQLEMYPGLGRIGRVPGTRELVVPKTPYLVPYRIVGESLQILRVYHGARRWPGNF